MATIKRKNTYSFWNKPKASSTKKYSSYWLGRFNPDNYESMFADEGASATSSSSKSKSKSRYDIFKLIEARSAISNFVRILTQRSDVAIRFNDGQTSENYTDGKTIVISPDLNNNKFDIAVGLALHESSHIIYTDFEKMKNAVLLFKNEEDAKNYKFVWNCIEDFYIDAMTYNSSPGYRGYFQALYHEYFGSPQVVKGFKSKRYSMVEWDSYLFHLCNIRNPKRNLNALPDLTRVWEMLDLANIIRLSNPADRIVLAHEIYDIINRNIKKQAQTTQQQPSENTATGYVQDVSGDSESMDGDAVEMDDVDGNGQGEGEGEADDNETDTLSLSQDALKKIETLFKKQLDYYDGSPKRGKLSKTDAKVLQHMTDSNAEVRTAGKGHANDEDGMFVDANGVRVLVVKNIDKKLASEGAFSMFNIHSDVTLNGSGWLRKENMGFIESGILAGKRLGRKIQLRNEERVSKTTRLKHGNIDRRLLSELGFDNYKIFSKLNVKTFKPVHIHVSIDQSGSMSGQRFYKSIELASALATASLMIKNLHVVVSLRGTTMSDTPYIAYVFDSTKHNLAHLRDILSRCNATSSTPEALCFEAIEREIKNDALHNESYFINICDGEPACSYRSKDGGWRSYGGWSARKHCRREMLKMEKHGVKYMAYFITDDNRTYYNESSDRLIKECYGDRVISLRGANEIDKIANTFNKKLVETLY